MRLRQTRLETLYVRSLTVTHTADGDVTDWEEAAAFQCTSWPAGGRVQTEMYGNRVQDVLNVKVPGKYKVELDETTRQPIYRFQDFILKLNDGVCIYAASDATPDYRIVSIKPYKPLLLEVMRI